MISSSNNVTLVILHVRGKWVTTNAVQIWSPLIIYQWQIVLSGISLVSYRWWYWNNIHVTANLKTTGRFPILARSWHKVDEHYVFANPSLASVYFVLAIHILSQHRCKLFLVLLARCSNCRRWANTKKIVAATDKDDGRAARQRYTLPVTVYRWRTPILSAERKPCPVTDRPFFRVVKASRALAIQLVNIKKNNTTYCWMVKRQWYLTHKRSNVMFNALLSHTCKIFFH
jgi:hypothetical protein